MSLKEFRLIPQYSNFSRRVNHLLLFRPDIPRVSQRLKEVLGKLMFIVIGARDFSPEITVHLIGTSVFALQAAPRQESPVLRQSSSPAKFQFGEFSHVGVPPYFLAAFSSLSIFSVPVIR